jgi:hypothetical protein
MAHQNAVRSTRVRIRYNFFETLYSRKNYFYDTLINPLQPLDICIVAIYLPILLYV